MYTKLRRELCFDLSGLISAVGVTDNSLLKAIPVYPTPEKEFFACGSILLHFNTLQVKYDFIYFSKLAYEYLWGQCKE